MSFAIDITEFVNKTKLKADRVLRKIALDAFTGLLKRSPVDTGRFRASWRAGVNAIDGSSEPVRQRGTREGPEFGALVTASEIGRINAVISAARFGDTIHLTNNLPYARRLESGWWSKQAPAGIVGPTFDEVTSSLEEAVRSVRGGET